MKKLLKNIISKKSEIIKAVFCILLLASLLLFLANGNVFSIVNFKRQPINTSSEELPALYPFPKKAEKFEEAPKNSARSVVVIDAKTGITLYEKEPNVRHLPASTTKLLTALVALEKCSPKDIVVVGNVNSEGTQMGLASGDEVSVEILLNGMLISSGNDAAYALAQSCGNSYSDFVKNMNLKAREIGLNNSHFQNPAGFDDPQQYSTAKDLAKLAKVAVANPLIAKIVTTQSAVVSDRRANKSYYLQNVNKLLGQVEGLEGVKTGQTEGSLEILLTKTTRSNNTIIVSLLGSQDRFRESRRLIEWAFKNYVWVNP